MPFVGIRLSGSATKDQKSAIVADVTRSLVERRVKDPAAVQTYGPGGSSIADRDAPRVQEGAHAESSR